MIMRSSDLGRKAARPRRLGLLVLPAPVHVYYSTFMTISMAPESNSSNSYRPFAPARDVALLTFTGVAFMSVSCVCMTAMNMVMLATIGQQRRKATEQQWTEYYTKVELRLAFSSGLIFLFHLLNICAVAALLFLGYSRTLLSLETFFVDAMNLSNPFVMFACSEAVREHFLLYVPKCLLEMWARSKTPVQEVQ